MKTTPEDAINELFNRLLLTNRSNPVSITTIHPATVIGKLLHKKFVYAYSLPHEEKEALRDKCIRYRVTGSTIKIWLELI